MCYHDITDEGDPFGSSFKASFNSFGPWEKQLLSEKLCILICFMVVVKSITIQSALSCISDELFQDNIPF